jgi:hypothetical protein
MIIMTSNTDDDNADYCGEKVDVEIFCFTGHRSKCFSQAKDLASRSFQNVFFHSCK